MTTKVVALQVQNFKRIKAVDMRPDGKSIVIGGRNAQGKTSILDALWAALGGGRAAPKEPVRRGQTKAKIVVELDGLTVTRKFTSKGSKLEVVGTDGGVMRSPQAVLDRLTGSLTFDPLAFTRQAPADQAETLRRLAGLDLTEIDIELKHAIDERRETKKYAARLRAQPRQEIEDAPESEVDISELVAELQAATKDEEHRRDLVRALARNKAEIEELLRKAEELRTRVEHGTSTLESLGEPRDLDQLRERIDAADEENRRYRLAAEARKASEALKQAESDVEESEEKVESLREARARAIEETEFPVDGLSVTDEGVTYKGVLLEQASAAEKIRISTAVGLAMNPELRVMLVRDGSLLDDDSLAEILAAAERDDLQLWVERVGNGKSVGVVIEDGQVQS